MARKFVGTREIAFIDSIVRELHQHVVDEEIYYYAIMLERTKVDDLYNEAIKKVWASPVRVTARVLYDNPNTKSGLFGPDSEYASEVYFHTDELLQRNLKPREGDFIEYGEVYYEITAITKPQLVFGQINNKLMTKCKLIPSREGQFAAGSNSNENRIHSHPVDNMPSYSRQQPEMTLPTYAQAAPTPPDVPFHDLPERVSGQRELPIFTNVTRPAPAREPGLEIFNSDANQEQRSDGTNWLDEDGNIVATSGVELSDPAPGTGGPTFVPESFAEGAELLPSFSNVTRPPANKVPGLEIYNTDAFQEQVSDGLYWRDQDGNICG